MEYANITGSLGFSKRGGQELLFFLIAFV